MARAARSGSGADLALFAVCVALAILATVLPPQMREAVAGTLRRSVMSPLVNAQRRAERWRAAWLTTEQVTLVRDSVALGATDAEALRLENDRMRLLLGLGGRLQMGFVPAEALQQTGGPEDVVKTLALTAGSNAGVVKYSPVVAPEGLVGMVQSVDPTTSLAIVFSHPDFRVSAMTVDGNAFGIVYPHAGTGSEAYLLEMRDVVFRSSLRAGTVIVSSGLGGTFPKGITIGTVLAETKATEGWARTYLVRPAVNPAHVTSVMILTPKRVAQGVANVWATNADSAARGVAIAADSITRQAAALDAAKRRARADSIRADSIRRDTLRTVP